MKKFLIVLTMFVTLFASISPSVFASSITSTKNSFDSYNGSVEVVEGTENNWTKLKVTDRNGEESFIKKEIVDGKDVYNVYEGNTKKPTITTNNEGETLLDGEKVEVKQEETLETNKKGDIINYANAGNGSSFYLIRSRTSSISADFNDVATGISLLLSVFAGMGYGIAHTIASYVVGNLLPELWYTEKTYSDKAVYQPTFKKFRYYYADPARTQFIESYYLIY
ncbi:hypothetical protein [Radiobacillus deserti]|uniref:Uncharacterized protein n=1 Tax=Radiobacillus deserti TaxID=2594883 RepID=A0A516KHC6_9BACI|nr:hypothetical protein [Radiobacillus deserti]QDP40792.1 hypothetical protein FN924_11710 [Radiobacillus deserti]